MKPLSPLLLTLTLLAAPLVAQPMLDVAPSGRQDVRFVAGGGVPITLDHNTSIDVLVARLEGPWEEHETGKGYWIGYTDDMFSIAARGDEAIDPLLELARTSTSAHARYGALLALHLIGIDRRVVGRFYEEFRQPRARAALLFCLRDAATRNDAMRLLMRDPWLSDVPELMDVMRTSSEDCWTIVNALRRYELEDTPLDPTIPQAIARIPLDTEKPGEVSDEIFFWIMLQRVKTASGNSVLIEDGLQTQPLWGEATGFGFTQPNAIPRTSTVGGFLHRYVGPEPHRPFSYCDFGNRVQRYREAGVIHICSAATAKNRWLTWWDTRTSEYRDVIARWTKPEHPHGTGTPAP